MTSEGAFRGVAVIVVAVALVVLHWMDVRTADARVLAAETDAAVTLADAREQCAGENAELRTELTSRAVERVHAAPTLGDRIVIGPVATVSGAAPAHVGDTCTTELDWNSDPIEGCRAIVRCGDALVYGGPGSGFFECEVDAAGIVTGTDEHGTADGGDPRLALDRVTHRLMLSDDAPAWSLTLAVPAEGD